MCFCFIYLNAKSVSKIWIVAVLYITDRFSMYGFCAFTYISSLTAPIYYSKYPQYKLFHQLTVSIRINFYRRLLRSSYFHYVFFVQWFGMGSWRQKSEHEIKLATTKWSNQRVLIAWCYSFFFCFSYAVVVVAVYWVSLSGTGNVSK